MNDYLQGLIQNFHGGGGGGDGGAKDYVRAKPKVPYTTGVQGPLNGLIWKLYGLNFKMLSRVTCIWALF